jgi:hypothetical protein
MFTSRLALVLYLVVASLVAAWGWKEATRYDALYTEQFELREAAEARTAKIQSNLRTVSSNYATSELRLRDALRAIPDRRTPDTVYNELCRRANCAKPGPMPTPAD